MIASSSLDLAFGQLCARRLARPVIAVIDTVASAIDRSARFREPGPPGTLLADFHVAGAPR